MRRASLFAALAAAVVALSAGFPATFSGSVEAGPPEFVPGQILFDSVECNGIVTWSGLKGGKKLTVISRLTDSIGDTIPGTPADHDVRQGDGLLIINYEVVAFSGFFEAQIFDSKGNQLDQGTVAASCS